MLIADAAAFGQAVAASAAELEIARKRVQDMEKTHKTKQEAASKVSEWQFLKFPVPSSLAFRSRIQPLNNPHSCSPISW